MKRFISSIMLCLLLINLSFTSASADTINTTDIDSSNVSERANVNNSKNEDNTYVVSETDEADEIDKTREEEKDDSVEKSTITKDKQVFNTFNNDSSKDNADNVSSVIKNIIYDAHVSKIGWQPWVNAGEIAGTTGRSLPMEAFKMSLKNKVKGINITYQAHVSKVGWQPQVKEGEVAGTTGRSLPMEALIINVEGLSGYTLQYQAHVSKIGWQPWVNAGEIAGTTGKSLPIEAIRIRIVETIHPKVFDIKESSVSLAIRDTAKLTTSFTPEDTTDKKIIWESSDPNIATIDENGVITAKSEGQVTVKGTTRDGNIIDTCNVEVHSIALTEISLNKKTTDIYVGKTDKLSAILNPSNTTNQNVKWTSSDNSIATIDGNGNIKGIKEGKAVITATSEEGNYNASCNVTIKDYHPSVTYRAYCQNQGWQTTVSDGKTAGTIGQALRIESLNIGLKGAPPGANINYNVYVHGKGWFNTASNNANTGTTNMALGIEGLKVYLTNCPGYTLQYRAYIQNLGWQSWVTDGMTVGALGRSLRIEAFEIKITKSIQVNYKTHQQNIGWTKEVSNSEISGTNGQPCRIEGMTVRLINAPKNASIKYQSHIEGIGWQKYASNGALSGTTGQSRRIEAIRCTLENLPGYKLQYQVFVQNRGWSNWTNAGEVAGTTGQGLRIEAVRFRILQVPEGTSMPYVEQTALAKSIANYLDSNTNIQSVNQRATELHNGDPNNTCVYFSSEVLRRLGVFVPYSMCNTANYMYYLSSLGFRRNYNVDALAIGDICFSVAGSYGYSTHTYVFMGWVTPEDHTRAYVADNQSNTIHVRSMIQTSQHDAFAFSMRR